ncbi:N-acetyltransferase [Escherichia coli]|nr:N-acetyltransferase [Escherichia coli]
MEIREGHNKFYINDEQGKQIAEIVIIPLCPFAKHEFDKTREYDDIRS